jgi:hypothetical protein
VAVKYALRKLAIVQYAGFEDPDPVLANDKAEGSHTSISMKFPPTMHVARKYGDSLFEKSLFYFLAFLHLRRSSMLFSRWSSSIPTKSL